VPQETPAEPASVSPEEPDDDPSPTTFGVTPSSVTEGESSTSVPVGGSVASTNRGPGTGAGGTGTGAGPAGPPGFAPVGAGAIASWPKVVHEEKPEFTLEARRLGVNATVMLKVGTAPGRCGRCAC
jgi:hypothetical protein